MKTLILLSLLCLISCGKNRSGSNSSQSSSHLESPAFVRSFDELFDLGIIPGEVISANGQIRPALLCQEIPEIKNFKKNVYLTIVQRQLINLHNSNPSPIMYQFGDCNKDLKDSYCYFFSSYILEQLITNAIYTLGKSNLSSEKCPKDILAVVKETKNGSTEGSL